MKRKAGALLQVAFGVGLIGILFLRMHRRGELGNLLIAFKDAAGNWPFIIGSIACFFVCIVICSCRWQLLLEAQGIQLGFVRIVELYFIGNFFNSFMPGATSGDILKAYYVARQAVGKRTEAVSTVFIDRIIGLVALIALTVVVMLIRLRFFLAYPQTRVAIVFNSVLLAGTIVGAALVFRRNSLERSGWFRRLENRTGVGSILTRAYTAFSTCVRSSRVLTATFILSLANHVCFIGSSYMMARALDLPLSYGQCLTVFPIINSVAALPITPGGLGAREAAVVFLLGTMGISETIAFSLSLLIYAMILAWSVVGGVIYLLFVIRVGKPSVVELATGNKDTQGSQPV